MSNQPPVFAVVGHVNKGKSSVISTLAEDDTVAISDKPGTTRRCRRYPVRVDDHTVFTLVDTPGFEEAAYALDWLRSEEGSAADRPARVRAFVEHFSGTDEFPMERALLQPVLEGAAVLYVVDGTRPYRAHFEPEMEILRWTGRPGMALINRIGDDDHAEAWRTALSQYFQVVRDFDAHAATFDERIRLLETFHALDDAWAPALEDAIDALRTERARRAEEAAAIVADLLLDALTWTLEASVRDPKDLSSEREAIEQRFHDGLREKEQAARRRVERLYGHQRAHWESTDLARPVFDEDLFAKKTWALLGLSPRQLIAAYTTAGVIAGGAIDAGVGGASIGAGMAAGGLVGLVAGAYHLKQQYASADMGAAWTRFKKDWQGGRTIRIGPHAHKNFPFVLLDRALLHHQSVRGRAHARQDQPQLDPEARGPTAALDSAARAELAKLFDRVRKSSRDVNVNVRRAVHDRINALVLENT
jgi:hypothetical protein